MSVSLKKATNKTNIKHNNRTMSDKEKERNSHIDSERSHENKYLIQKDLKELYQEEFSEALENYNAKQKRNDRKIDDYFKHIQSSKKTSLQQEMIIQVGDKDDFSSKADFEKANEILEEWFAGFEERNPNLKIYNAVIHNDEASPHMHLNFVPVADGYKRGLEKQVSFDRAITQQDPLLDKTRPFEDWREKEVLLLEKLLLERGIERKIVGTNDYKDVNEYKEKRDLEREIEKLKVERLHKKNEVDSLIGQAEMLKTEEQEIMIKMNRRKEELLEMNSLIPTQMKIKAKKEIEKVGFLKREEQETGNLIMSVKEYKRIQKIVHAASEIKSDYERLQGTDFVQENKKLVQQLNRSEREKQELKKDYEHMQMQLRTANREISDLRGRVDDLTYEVAILYQSTKEFFKERTNDFKEHLRDFVDKVREKLSGSEFERSHTRERRREMDRGMER